MSDPLGLSIGATNLVAARVGCTPLIRRAVLTLSRGRAPQVGAPPDASAPRRHDHRLRGARGSPNPLVAAIQSKHRPDQLRRGTGRTRRRRRRTTLQHHDYTARTLRAQAAE